MQFKEIIGQQELKERLVRAVESGRVSHAQLFTGKAGAGALAMAVAYF
jgi:DNA polymerase-3 subunit delta'